MGSVVSSRESHPELAQMMVQMLVLHHSPARARDAAKHLARRPGRGGSPRSKALHQVTQTIHVRLPRGRTRRKELGRALALPFGPPQSVNRQPVQRKTRQWPGGRAGLELTEPLAEVTTDMAH